MMTSDDQARRERDEIESSLEKARNALLTDALRAGTLSEKEADAAAIEDELIALRVKLLQKR